MDVNKEQDLKFIKEFKSITISNICKDLKVDKSNVYRGLASAETIRKVREEIERKLNDLQQKN